MCWDEMNRAEIHELGWEDQGGSEAKKKISLPFVLLVGSGLKVACLHSPSEGKVLDCLHSGKSSDLGIRSQLCCHVLL